MPLCLLILLVLFGIVPLSAQTRTIDSLQTILPTAKDDTSKVRLLNRLAQEQRGNPAQTRATGERAKTLAEQLGDKPGLVQAMNAIAFSHLDQGAYSQATDHAEQALALAQSINDKKGQSRALLTIGLAEWRQGDYDMALERCFKILPLQEEGDISMVGTLNLIGIIYNEVGNYARGREYLRKGIAIAEALRDTLRTAAPLNNIGDAYMRLRQYDSAIAYFHRSAFVHEHFHNTIGLAMTLTNIGECYTYMRKFSDADTALTKALQMASELGSKDLTAYTYRIYCLLYTAQGSLEKAIRYGTIALTSADSIGSLPYRRDALEALSAAYSAQGDNARAFNTYKRFIALRDSLVSDDNAKKAAYRETKYLTDKKDKAILLLQKEREKQALIEKQQTSAIIAISLAFVFTLAFGVVLVRSNRSQKRDNMRLQAMSRIGADLAGSLVFQEVVLKIHHEVNQLMDAPIFNIGIYLPQEERIEFRYLIENGDFLPPPSVQMSDEARPAVQCVRQRKEIVINDHDIPILVGTKPQSLVYMPLISNDIVLGVFSVQSLHKNSYSPSKVEFLRAISSHIATAMQNVQAFEEIQQQREALALEREKSERLLLNILPPIIAERMKHDQSLIADYYQSVSVMFVDVVGFTTFSQSVNAHDVVTMLDGMFSKFDAIMVKYNLEKIKTIGDAYLAASGVPTKRSDHTEAIARAALDIQELMGNRVRIGIHTGSVIAGVIGTSKFSYDLWGDTVNTASRMESQGEAGKIHVSEEVFLALKDTFIFEERGEMEVKGKGMMRTWFLLGSKI
ncbi:MAG: tetratricopeptide repeat protein [Candidatus Kapabacteria bacterium]|jgi:class 3 adenylate cyclase/tetratricopeptide (TPR) repeat protein|nr:tetratricopeptide repeat protein [Candidatus Kapabacteria bacterium]